MAVGVVVGVVVGRQTSFYTKVICMTVRVVDLEQLPSFLQKLVPRVLKDLIPVVVSNDISRHLWLCLVILRQSVFLRPKDFVVKTIIFGVAEAKAF